VTTLLAAILLGVIEGLTEFIPVSSTGHLILAGHLLGWQGARAATFEIFIQLGAILAVVLLYKDRFLGLLPREPSQGLRGYHGLLLLALTTLPALVIGAATHGYIKRHLFNPTTVAMGLGIGGVAIIVLERLLSPAGRRVGLDAVRWQQALAIGVFQCLSLWPGVSRAAATILGAMCVGLERKTAIEYSFLAAVPVLCAATLFDLLKSFDVLQSTDIPVFAIGFVCAFLSAFVAIRYFLRFLSTHTLVPFGWYRIVIALMVFLFLQDAATLVH
jgi:undecaprenyl-diphosphatase